MFNQKLLMGGIGVAALLAFGAVFTYIVGDNGMDATGQLKLAMNLLDEGRWDVAGRIARDLNEAGQVDPAQDSAWLYVQGVSKILSVQDDLDTPKNRQVLLDATAHLLEADSLEFPLGYQGKGHYYLGFCLFNTYRWDEAIAKLVDVPREWPERRSDALRMIFLSHLNKQVPDEAAAESSLAEWEEIPGLSESELARFDVASAQLFLYQRKFDECEQRLLRVREELQEYWEALLWRARWRINATARSTRQPTEENLLANEAEAILRKLMVSANTPSVLRRQAAYLSGINLRQQGREKESISAFSGIRQRNPRSSESIASGLEEAEILLEMGNPDEAISIAHHMLRNIEDLNLYNTYWVRASELRSRLLALGAKLRDQQQYEKVILLAKHIELAFPLKESIRLQAETYERWGNDLSSATQQISVEDRSTQRQKLQDLFLLAAERYEQLATLELRSTEYPDIIWSTIENYQRANELTRANALLKDYLRHEDRLKRPRGFLALGRNYLNMRNWTRALEPLERCLFEYPANPVSYEARLMAAKAKSELDALDEAIELLESNMGDFQLDPKSPVWRDSLFELGQVVFRRGEQLLLEARVAESQDLSESHKLLEASQEKFLKAVRSLGQAASAYPNDPRYYEARYLIAKAYQLASETPQTLAKSQLLIVDSARRQLIQQRRELLEKSLEEFRSLYTTINNKEDAVSTFENDLAIIRNCYFGEADTLFKLERWDDSIQAYRNAASHFLNRPESLEALAQMAVCYRKMGREFEAKKAIAQAEQVLLRIPPEYDSNFVGLTRADRRQWTDILDWMKN
jgi:tetratricopeptide (TPR) repeat protein